MLNRETSVGSSACAASCGSLERPSALQCSWELHLKPPKFEHTFVAMITSFSFLLCRYFGYYLVAYCLCFKIVCKISL